MKKALMLLSLFAFLATTSYDVSARGKKRIHHKACCKSKACCKHGKGACHKK